MLGRKSSGIQRDANASRVVETAISAFASAGRHASAKRSSKLTRSGFAGNAAEAVGSVESVIQAATISDAQIAAVTNRIVLGQSRRDDRLPDLAARKAIEPPTSARQVRTPIPHGSVEPHRVTKEQAPRLRHNRDERYGFPHDFSVPRAVKIADPAPPPLPCR